VYKHDTLFHISKCALISSVAMRAYAQLCMVIIHASTPCIQQQIISNHLTQLHQQLSKYNFCGLTCCVLW